MERGSPQNSTSSSLEQSKLSSIMPHFLSPRQIEKRPRVVDAEEHTSYLALLTGAESPKAQQIGSSFPKAPIFTPFGDPGVDCWTPNVMPTIPTPIRPMVIQGTRNTPCLSGCINLASNGKAYEGSTLKRKTVCDDIAPNPNIWSFSDQGYNSRNYGSVGHGYSIYDERYRALGLHVDPHLRLFTEIYGKGNAGLS